MRARRRARRRRRFLELLLMATIIGLAFLAAVVIFALDASPAGAPAPSRPPIERSGP